MNCAKCKDVVLLKVINGASCSLSHYECSICKGVFITGERIHQLDEVDRKKLQGKISEGLDSKSAMCPGRHGVMQRAKIEDFYIDKCAKCFGVFFDSGELARVLKSENRDKVLAAFKPLKMKRQELVQKSENMRSQIAKTYGDEVVTKIDELVGLLESHNSSQALVFLLSRLGIGRIG